MEWWRDMLLVREGCAQLVTNIDREETLRRHADSYNIGEIRGFIEAIRTASAQLAQNANPRLVLEVLMLNIPKWARKGVERNSARACKDE
jgi:DNA polymerase-3 subunit delta'